MKIGIFDPYLDTLGGGERYIFTLASFLSKQHEVTIFWDNQGDLGKLQELLDIDISRVKFASNIFKEGIFKKIIETRKYDAIFYMSDGSIPFLFSKKSFLIFQFPVNWVNGKNLVTKIKLYFVKNVICYSNFVKDYIDKSFGVKSLVIEPSLRDDFKTLPKENIILSVGRFTKGLNTKNQEFMISAFNRSSKIFSNWQLILVGSRLDKDKDYVESLRNKIGTSSIKIFDNLEYSKVRELFSQSKIYWHAAGYGQDLQENPENAEHFGISTVEAMAAGAVPVVFNGGGLREIVGEDVGFLWENEKQLIGYTKKLIEDHELWREKSKNAIKKSKIYSEESFYKKIDALIN